MRSIHTVQSCYWNLKKRVIVCLDIRITFPIVYMMDHWLT